MRQNRRNAKVGVGARLGQHFLKGLWAARALAGAAGIAPGDTVLEIGPGKGALTRQLLGSGDSVIAIEKDRNPIAILEAKFPNEINTGSLKIVEADIRDVTPEDLHLKNQDFILAANIPYYITGEIIRQFLSGKTQPRTIALLVQKEVAQRIVSGKESVLSLSVKAYCTPVIVRKVAKGNFSLPPSVDSAILLIKNISRNFFSGIKEKDFFDIVHAGFSSKRKILAGNLARKFGPVAREALMACGIPEKARAEDVPLEKWGCFTKQLLG